MQKRAFPNPASNLNGFTLFEILLAVLFLAVAVAPILNAYAPAIFATTSEEELSVFSNRCRGTLNRVAAFDFATLDSNKDEADILTALLAGEAANETFDFRGSSYTPAVTITASDQDEGEGGLLEIAVTVGSVTVKTLRAQY